MKSNSQEEIIDLSELVRPTIVPNRPVAEAAAPAVSSKRPVLLPPLEELIKQIPQPLQTEALHLFAELHQLLKYLELVEAGIKQDKALDKTVLIFVSINSRARLLLERLKQATSHNAQGYLTLHDTLEGICFAVQHELRRIFDEKLIILQATGAAQSSRAAIARAYGILYNCFQQSTITLAQVFDPTLDGKVIFEDYKIKQEQSVILHRELSLLLQKLHRVNKEAGILQTTYLINSLKQFQQETMYFLMHRDWDEFERFVNEIVQTYDEMGDLATVFDRFAAYLETLLKQVSLRAVLNDKPVCAAEMIS